jgi:hypothetical protein
MEAAVDFGLTQEEAWRAFLDSLERPPDAATTGEYLDEIAGVLAREILAKQRRILGQPRR